MKSIFQKTLPPILYKYVKLTYSQAQWNLNYEIKRLVRKNTAFKNKYEGQRCFLLGSAPSINIEDLTCLKNEIVFALNNFYVHPDFEVIMDQSKPKFYVTAPIHSPQTEEEWRLWFTDMEGHMPADTQIFFGLNSYEGNIKYVLEKYNLFKKHNINWYYTDGNFGNYLKSTHIQMDKVVWSASTVSTYALMIAIYMGFSEIYLLGIDQNYICMKHENDYRFYKSSSHQKDEHKRMNFNNLETLRGTVNVLEEKKWLNEHCLETKIYNCSASSLIDIFPKVSLHRVINENTKKNT